MFREHRSEKGSVEGLEIRNVSELFPGRVWDASARDLSENGRYWWENLYVEAKVRVG